MNKLVISLTLMFFSTGVSFSTAQSPVLKVNSAPLSSEQWRTITPDVVYGHKAGMALTFDVIRPTKNANGAGVLFIVSGGWRSRWSDPQFVVKAAPKRKNIFEKIVSSGYTLFLVRHGSSPQFKVPEAVADVRKSLRHIRRNSKKFGVDANRLGVCGGSAGGHLSLILGTTGKGRNRVKAVVAFYPPTDLRGIFADKRIQENFPATVFDKDLVDDVSPLLQVSSDDAPTLLIHGDRDTLVPIWHSRKIAKQFTDLNVKNKLIVVSGAAHGFNGDDKQKAESALLEWFDEQLSVPPKKD